MKKIYSAGNLPEAYLVRDLLRQGGVAARILNEHAMAAMGEMPMSSSYPQVWIEQDHQETHARAVIADYERRGETAAPRICDQCGESNPGGFDLCWNCATPFGAI